MTVSPALFGPAIQELIEAPKLLEVAGAVRGIVDLCAHAAPHPDWATIRAIDWAADLPKLRSWFRQTLQSEQPSAPIRGIYFACCQRVLPSGGATADMQFVGTQEFDPADLDQEWIFTRHYFSDACAESAALDQLYGLAYRTHDWRKPVPGALGNDAELPVGLAFGVLAARAIVEGLTTRDLPTDAARVGIAAGWNEGDLLVLGEITDVGFMPVTSR